MDSGSETLGSRPQHQKKQKKNSSQNMYLLNGWGTLFFELRPTSTKLLKREAHEDVNFLEHYFEKSPKNKSSLYVDV